MGIRKIIIFYFVFLVCLCTCSCSSTEPDPQPILSQSQLNDLASQSVLAPPSDIDIPVEITYEGFTGYFPGYDATNDSWISVESVPNEAMLQADSIVSNNTDGTVVDDVPSSPANFDEASQALQDIFQGVQAAANAAGIAGNTVENKEPTSANTKQPENSVSEPDLLGAPFVGVFSVPRINLAVKCYKSSSQAITDAENAANYFYAVGHWIVADHNHQNFHLLKSCQVGDIAYAPDSTQYQCIDIMPQGRNTGTELTTSDGTSIDNIHPGALVAYTCNDTWRSVTIVFFMPVDE